MKVLQGTMSDPSTGLPALALLLAFTLAGCPSPPPPLDLSGPVAGWPEYAAAPGGGTFSPATQIFGVQRFELADTLDDVERGDVADTTSPTTAAQVGDRLLVVNSQIDRQDSGPELPFTVSEIPAP